MKSSIKRKINDLIEEYFALDNNFQLDPSKDRITVGFPCFDHREISRAVSCLLDLRLSQGPKVKEFEEKFSSYIGTKYGVAVNSGSSANLIAIAALIKAGLVKKGSEVIIPATTFTTVVSPIIQNGLIPVFVDVDRDSYNINCDEIEKAINPNTGLIMPVHTLGLPADMESIMKIADKHNIPVFEDCCEAHGASINGKKVGSFGIISAYSFFVAHNMTTGEGGMVMTSDDKLNDLLFQLREFGRLKKYKEGEKRFYYTNGELVNFDERYAFEVIGYNLRMTDVCASIGVPQLNKLDDLNEQRTKITEFYTKDLSKHSEFLQLPITPKNYYHSVYGYPITIKENELFDRKELVNYLEDHRIDTRAILAGNLAIQPAYRDENIKIVGDLKNSNYITNNSFFIGCHSFINEHCRHYVTKTFDNFFNLINTRRSNDE